ncbi:D-alanyl-lipoteichoic acid biosynthesis protein DltB [Verrucomicrobiota bacterium sgz303538]
MTPYADFLFFGLMLYIVIPTVLLGLFGKANSRWALISTVFALIVLLSDQDHAVRLFPNFAVNQVWIVLGYAVYQAVVALVFLRWRKRSMFYAALTLAILPLALQKVLPILPIESRFGFLGISYVTFRALDVIFSIQDKLITSLNPAQYFAFLLFFPTVSSGPIDRYRRFGQDWARIRGRSEFLDDLDAAVQRIFQGFLYKFILAALISTYWKEPLEKHAGALATTAYMYVYTAYLFFDFAGYSAFAIGFSRLFGVRTPENFDKPFLSRNIRDFWNRWHMSLSFWFRDHIYMRFLLAASKGKWFKGKHTASYVGLFLTFGIMGVWHGLEVNYIVYGLYHASLLCGYDAFARWNKQQKFWPDGRGWRVLNIILTAHAFAFSLLIFSGRLNPKPPPQHDEVAEKIDCHEIVGWVWDRDKPNEPLNVDIYIDDTFITRMPANELRPDLKDRGFGNGLHGFRYAMPDWIRDGRARNVEVKVVESGRPLRGSPHEVVCGQ